MSSSLSFNHIKKPWIYLRRGRKKAPFAPLKRNLLYVPGMPGAHLQSTDTDVLAIEQPIGFRADTDQKALQLKDELASWLITKDPVPLQFDDEPGRTYYAVVQNTLEDFEKLVTLRQGTIQFLCLDPYGYGPELIFSANAVTGDMNTLVMNNPGNVQTFPTFHFLVKKPLTYLDIIGPDGYMRIGRPVSVEETTINPLESVLTDNMNTLIGWANASNVDGGVRAGNFQANSNGFTVSDFGQGTSWHGPSLQKSLGQTLENFQVEMHFTLRSLRNTEVGRIELYLVDENGNHFAKIAMKDILTGDFLNQAEIRVGPLVTGQYIVAGSPRVPDQWRPFTGLIRISRVEGKWVAYVANVAGRHVAPLHGTFLDNGVLPKLAAIQVHIGVSKDRNPSQMTIRQVKVWKRNVIKDDNVPYIAFPGDEIIINHKNSSIQINGEDMKKLKDFGSTYFPLQKGDTALLISPGDAVDAEGKARGAYH